MMYTVAPGDTFVGIASRFGVPLNQLLAFNNLSFNSPIFPGMIIMIPSRPPITPVPPIGTLPQQNIVYIVRRGDTIWSISQHFGVSVQNIMFINGLTFPIVFPGQRLIIPRNITLF